MIRQSIIVNISKLKFYFLIYKVGSFTTITKMFAKGLKLAFLFFQ